MPLNTGYLQTNRGIIKILQIICGIIANSLLCFSFSSVCYYADGFIGYSSGLSSVILIVNIVLLVLNLVGVAVQRLERLYSVIGVILFAVAFGLMFWKLIESKWEQHQFIPATVIIGIQMVLFIWDYQILHGQSSNW